MLNTAGHELTAAGCYGKSVLGITELEFDQTANLAADAEHDRAVADAGAHAEPIPELQFDQTLGWQSCVVEMAHAAERGLVWIRH